MRVPASVTKAIRSFRETRDATVDLIVLEGHRSITNDEREDVLFHAYSVAQAVDEWLRLLAEGKA